tara:strand:- start:224 stop:412 length:189 start_codon:yes stop_codon:yes gene_type:complete
MKYLIILLLTTSGLEQIKYPIKKNLTCEEQMIEWRDANATYHDYGTRIIKIKVGIQRKVIYG